MTPKDMLYLTYYYEVIKYGVSFINYYYSIINTQIMLQVTISLILTNRTN